MTTKLRDHTGVVAYLIFAGIVVVALAGYQRHVNGHFRRDTARFEHADRQSCLNRRILVANQALVLAILHRNILGFVRLARTPDQRVYFSHSLTLVEQAQERLERTPAC